MADEIKVREQKWNGYTRYLLFYSSASVFLDIYDEVNEEFGGKAFLWALYVDEDSRRKGLGTIVLEYAEEVAMHKGQDSIYLVWEKSTPRYVLEWYKRLGYEEVEFGSESCLLKKIL